RLTAKEQTLAVAITNTEEARSLVEDADFAKEQMQVMKLQILQQTAVASLAQANASPQVVLSLFG
ncbi:MAG: flagellin, partial [Desulfobacterales bacterium]